MMSYICIKCKTVYSSEEYAKDKFCSICGKYLERYQEPRIRNITFTTHEEGSNYWLIPVQNKESITRLIVEEQIWAYGIDTPGRYQIKPGDWACFYLSKHGIVAHGQILTKPEKKEHSRVKDPVQYPWIFMLGKISVHLDNPVTVSEKIRKQLDAFKKTDPVSTKSAIDQWGWFVMGNKQISFHDFKILIGARIQ